MYDNRKIVAITPVGRKRYLEVLFPYIVRNRDILDEYIIYVNTDREHDVAFVKEFAKKYDFVKVVGEPYRTHRQVRMYLEFASDADTTYIKIDDDIVFIDDNAIKNLVQCKLENPQYFLVIPNLINQSLVSHIHQDRGIIHTTQKCPKPYVHICPVAWGDGKFSEEIHRIFLDRAVKEENLIDIYDIGNYETAERFHICAVCFNGSDINEVSDCIKEETERGLTEIATKKHGKVNCICGNSIMSHYSYRDCPIGSGGLVNKEPRKYLDSTNILEEYKKLLYMRFSGGKDV